MPVIVFQSNSSSSCAIFSSFKGYKVTVMHTPPDSQKGARGQKGVDVGEVGNRRCECRWRGDRGLLLVTVTGETVE